MLVKKSKLNCKIYGLARRAIAKIENDNESCIEVNGESVFISNLFDYLKYKTGNNTKTIFDVGANVGSYTDYLLSASEKYNLSAELHLFEPMRSAITELNKKYKNNNKIYINQNAITNNEQDIKIYFDCDSSPIASLYKRDLSILNIELNKSELIRGIPLRKYIIDKAIKHIDFMKIDVEGSEVTVLKSLGEYLSYNFIDFIQFEYGGTYMDSRSYLKDCYELLVEREFMVGKLLKKGVQIRDYKPEMENFSYSNYIAISKKCISNLSD